MSPMFEDDYFDDDEPPEEFGQVEVAGTNLCCCDGPHCEGCGCCEHAPCDGGCVWATPTLCSRCI